MYYTLGTYIIMYIKLMIITINEGTLYNIRVCYFTIIIIENINLFR